MIKYLCDGCGAEISEAAYPKLRVEEGTFCTVCRPIVQVIVGDLNREKKIRNEDTDQWCVAEKARLIEEQCKKTAILSAGEATLLEGEMVDAKSKKKAAKDG